MNETVTPYNNFQNTRHFASLDGLRCFCILAVLWHHSIRPENLPLQSLTRGFLGVDMFFVLSGFLITALLIRERTTHGNISLRAFWARRSLRIFPIYYLMLFVLAIMYLVTAAPDDPNRIFFFDNLIYNLTYTSNWNLTPETNLSPLWSLATEEQFYLLWPLAEVFASKHIKLVFYFTLLTISQAFNFGFLYALLPTNTATYLSQLEVMQCSFTPILLGVGLAYLLHHKPSFNLLASLLHHRFTPFIITIILFALIECTPAQIIGYPRLLIQLAMTALTAAVVIREDHFARPILAFKPIVFVGAISYGLYLYHPWTLHFTRILYQKMIAEQSWPLIDFILGSIISISIAALSFKLLETPILKLKHRFSRTLTSESKSPILESSKTP
ncbi:acyltransferase family protein [Poriferisphaera sp. WC338]|uniref:acyltransferase family protein n=1 Tax=Poriferisphaera sp. WC338 TaxID=3425129 RepID=UPI003D815988